jgi:phosphoglycolate phosphatase-like HAD superfamily hydrolase
MKRMKYIFFDFDGTISDARKLVYDVLIDVLDKMDFKFSRLKVKKLMGAHMDEILRGVGIDEGLVNEIRKKFYDLLVRRSNLKRLRLCCDVAPLYELKEEGYRLIVVSNGHSVFLNSSIKILGIEDLFYETYGADTFGSKDELLKKLIKKYKLDGNRGLYIGDRFSDIDYAHLAHMTAVAIHNKCAWSTAKEIMAENPEYIIHDFEDLKELVEKLDEKLDEK